MKPIPGAGLLLLGSGLYWILSSRLISSFTVLSPGLFQSSPFDQNLITTVGVISAIVGLWSIDNDLALFPRLVTRPNGYLYTIPIVLVNLDIYSTIFSLSLNSQAMELNPFVASAIQYSSITLVPFLVSYLALSEGVALLMIATGTSLFGTTRSNRFLPYSIICGAIGSIVLATLALRSLTRITALRPPATS